MSSAEVTGFTVPLSNAPREAVDPPRKRVTPPLFIHDILTSERGVPTLLAHWFAARDMARWDDQH